LECREVVFQRGSPIVFEDCSHVCGQGKIEVPVIDLSVLDFSVHTGLAGLVES
jgi:hypothetical protein